MVHGIRIAAAVVFAAMVGCGPSTAKKTLCASQLKQMWTLQAANKTAKPDKTGKPAGMPASTGKKFWLDVQSSPGAQEDLDSFVCPLSGKAPGKGVVTYRGPLKPVASMKDGDCVGACSGIHSDGSVTALYKNGSVLVLEKGDPAIAGALKSTSN
jgi:hypothetical protein